MGAGQIGGIATLLDIDFHNAAGFVGKLPDVTDGQYVVMYMSHAMIFCVGALIEAHVVLTPAICVYGERYKFDIVAGTHRFLEFTGSFRQVQHLCIHRAYNHSNRFEECSPDNLALLVLNKQYSFHRKELHTDYIINRVRYGASTGDEEALIRDQSCVYFGWGSRRNGYLIPLLIDIRRVNVVLLPQEKCLQAFNFEKKFLCLQQHPCKSAKFGTLCPDDVGSVIVCSGFVRGMMISRIVDRPCGIGFLDLAQYNKFLMCGVDDSRDVIDHDDETVFDFTTNQLPIIISLNETHTPHDF